jgi:Sec-independent protein translocase protein TatA
VGLGTEVLFILMLGLLVLGPKQLHTLLGHMARAKAQFEEASRGFKSHSRRNSTLRSRRERLMLRMNWLGTSELSSAPQYRSGEPLSLISQDIIAFR